MCETQFIKSDLSPKNFDDMVSDQAILCEWSRKIQTIIRNVNFSNLDPIDASWFEPPVQKLMNGSILSFRTLMTQKITLNSAIML